MEAMPFKHRNLVSTATAMIDKVILVSTTLALKYHESNWIHIMVPGVIFSVLATINSLMLYDSPQYFHDTKDYTMSRRIFQQIAFRNGLRIQEDFKFEKEAKRENKYLPYTSALNRSGYESISKGSSPSQERRSYDISSDTHSEAAKNRPMFKKKSDLYQCILSILIWSVCILNDYIL